MISGGAGFGQPLMWDLLGTEGPEAEAQWSKGGGGSVVPRNTRSMQFSQAISGVLKMQMELGL